MELPRLEPLWQKYRDKGFSVVAVEVKRDRDRALKIIDKYDLTYHLLENDGENDVVGQKFGVKAFPTSFVIDGDGKIMYCHLGFQEGDEVELEREILELVSR